MTRKQPKRTSRPGVDGLGRTPLHYAAASCNFDLVDSLLMSGADPNARDDNGLVALHFAAQARTLLIAERLLTVGAVVDAQDCWGNTPLSTAVFNSRGDGSMIKLLRHAGADCCVENNFGISPVSLARTIANFDVAQFFADVAITEKV